MAQDSDIADDVIPGSLKRSRSYHADYGKKTYRELKELAAGTPPDQKARQMKKLIEQTERLLKKGKGAAVMSNSRSFKQRLSTISRLWEQEDFDKALTEVEALIGIWPGNPHLHILRASLIQLQEKPIYDLEEARQTLQHAVDLDRGSPTAAIELGHFLDNVEDDPQAAVRAYTEGVATARQLLIDGLIGQARAYRQLEKKEEFVRCLLELLPLTQFDKGSKSPYAEAIQELLGEMVPDRAT